MKLLFQLLSTWPWRRKSCVFWLVGMSSFFDWLSVMKVWWSRQRACRGGLLGMFPTLLSTEVRYPLGVVALSLLDCLRSQACILLSSGINTDWQQASSWWTRPREAETCLRRSHSGVRTEIPATEYPVRHFGRFVWVVGSNQYSKQISVHYKHPKKVQSTYLLHLNILKSACIAMHENTKNSITLSLKETKCLVCNICWCRIVRVEVVVLLCFRREVSLLS
jgi:hypothetical protein